MQLEEMEEDGEGYLFCVLVIVELCSAGTLGGSGL